MQFLTPESRSTPPPSAYLLAVGTAEKSVFRLDRPLTLIGSKAQNHLCLASSRVSGSHALLLNLGNNFFIFDLMSRQGVAVNGRQVREARLKYGDIVAFGDLRFKFIDRDVLRESLDRFVPPAAQLTVAGSEAPIALGGRVLVIGRRPGAGLCINDNQLSSAHAAVVQVDGAHLLRDLNSRTGAWVNGQPVEEAELHDGDLIQLGTIQIRYELTGVADEATGRDEPANQSPPMQMSAAAIEEFPEAAEPAAGPASASPIDHSPPPPRTLELKKWGPLAAAVGKPELLALLYAGRPVNKVRQDSDNGSASAPVKQNWLRRCVQHFTRR